MKYIEITEEIEEQFNEHGCRLSNIKHVLNLFLYCLNNDSYSEAFIEIYCLGSVLREYFLITKEKYNKLEDLLGVDR